MSIHIIKRTEGPDEILYESICERCRSLLQFGATDGKMVFIGLKDFIQVQCPNCGTACFSRVRSR